ncbi:MAG: thioredoxin domain-containing protein [Bacteroidetes bacterium]|nr:MAG: thioredoxin domain-containing protein [Bacteroidota bacterium]
MTFLRTCAFALFLTLCFGCQFKTTEAQSGEHKYTNALINETSPYLLQHAHNPVNWHPWNEETLKKAKDENKMLLISIGYAACHWCHVMEHESFEDTTVARIMNENFIPVKVDREERPDVDNVYMTACHLATGRGCGWPLNSFALPDGRPVWAGTYFPKKEWIKVLEYFIQLRKEDPEKLEEYAGKLTEGVQTAEEITIGEGDREFTRAALDGIAQKFLDNIDFKMGGRVGSPKFPMPNNYEFLLKYHHLSGDEKALEAVTVTLDNLAKGGIYDHLGGGFARYSVDGEWKVPHFEKMLYDNGQLVSLFSHAYQLTHNPTYEQIVRQTTEFVRRDMTSPEGAFYASYDADSEGEEGRFYVWTKSEIDSLLGDQSLSDLFADFYEIKARGNWEDGKNILYRRKTTAEIAQKHQLTESEVVAKIEQAKKTLFQAREQRTKPRLDDKILTSWNALMITGFADAYEALGEESYREQALKAGNFILKNVMDPDFRLHRNYKDGRATINAFLDDYALTIQAFIQLYEITFDQKWLDNARQLSEYVLAHFADDQTGMFFYTSKLDPALIARKIEIADNVIPSSNSTMARNLYALGLYFYKHDYVERAKNMMHNLAADLVNQSQPNFYSNWCSLYLDLVHPPYEVAIVGPDFEAKKNALMRHYIPNAILLGGATEGNLELLKGKLQTGATMIYVCQNKVCKLPVEDPERALTLMQ